MKSILPGLSVLAFVPLAHSATVTLPFTDDFNGATTDFTPGATSPIAGSWSLSGGKYQNTDVPQATSASLIQATNFVAGQNFQLSTTFTVTDLASTFTIGFAALATASNIQNTGVNYYLADLAGDGSLRIGSFNASTFSSSAPFVPSTAAIGAISASDVITLTLDGVYTGSNLVLTLSATKNSNPTVSVSTGTITSPFAGNYFGLRNRDGATAGSGDNMTVQFDSFTMTQVPEPGTAILAGIGALGLILRRRR